MSEAQASPHLLTWRNSDLDYFFRFFEDLPLGVTRTPFFEVEIVIFFVAKIPICHPPSRLTPMVWLDTPALQWCPKHPSLSHKAPGLTTN